MKAKHHQKDDQRKSECNQSDDNIRKVIERSFFEWSDGMRVIRQGKGEVAMTEGELAKFFGVSWQKVNHKVRLIKQTMCLKYYEIEDRMKEYSEFSGIGMDALDLVLWYKEAGEVFK